MKISTRTSKVLLYVQICYIYLDLLLDYKRIIFLDFFYIKKSGMYLALIRLLLESMYLTPIRVLHQGIYLAPIRLLHKDIYYINCRVRQGFPALRKAVTTHVKKKNYIFSRVLIKANQLHVTHLWHHSVRLMDEQQSLHNSQYKLFVGVFLNYGS